MRTLKQMLGTQWDVMRILRLAVGLWIGAEAVSSMQIFPALVSVFFLYQAITGTGCCGTQACAPTRRPGRSTGVEDVDYEEVK